MPDERAPWGPPESVPRPSISAAHALQLAEVVARWGITPEELLQGSGLDVAAMSDPRMRVPLPVLGGIVARAKQLTGEPGLGFHLGLQMRISSHGYLGFAAMSSPTLRGALDVAVRFLPTRTDALAMRIVEGDGEVSIVLDELECLGDAADVLILSLVIGLNRIAEGLTGQRILDRADIAFAEPAYVERFQHLVKGRIRFGQPVHRLVLPAATLDLPLVQADASALRLAREQCERELTELGDDGQIVRRLRALLVKPDGGFRTLSEVAAILHLSSRTLKRRLARDGTDFSTLLDEQRRDRAIVLLRSTDLSMAAVAAGAGYSDVANFTRAFRRWTGATPAAHRRGAR
jgi:AraC-like DNA-binding protein